jgi:hypothetical protein
MTKSLLATTLAAATVALALSACDQQEASDNSSVPLQQGAKPLDNGGTISPMAPGGGALPEAQPDMEQPETTPPEAMPPETMPPSDGQ